MSFYDQYLNILRAQQAGQPMANAGQPMADAGSAIMPALMPQKPAGLLGGFDDPMTQGLLGAGSALLQASGPSTTPTSLGQAIGRAGQVGLGAYSNAQKSIAQNQLAQAKLLNELKPKQYVVDGNLVNESGGVTYRGTGDTSIVKTLRAAGIDPQSPEGQAIIRENLVKPQTQVNMGNALPGKIAEIATESLSAAKGAQEQLATSQRIRTVLKSGNVVTGAGADWKIMGLRIADSLGVSGANDQEKLANTQNVIKGLAQQTLASRQALKGQGQISDNETALLERAASGDVSLTIPEINTILDVNDRAANMKVSNHNQLLKRMKGHKDFSQGADFFALPGGGNQPTPANNDPLGIRK